MREKILLNQNWFFTRTDGTEIPVELPHTWNNLDGQDGGNDYERGSHLYHTEFDCPAFDRETQSVYLEFQGVNASAAVELNGRPVMTHDGGYSTFRADVTDMLAERNQLAVRVDNSVNDRVYPQKADFTFYGGIYREVSLLIVPKVHFDLDYFGGQGIQVTATPRDNYTRAEVHVTTWVKGEGNVAVTLMDAAGKEAARGQGTDVTMFLEKPHLWNGVKDPYLYTAVATLDSGDEVSVRFGVRDFKADAKKGFILNGKPYPLHGVSRHQDRKDLGNAINRAEHLEDMNLICKMGCNTIRLAHYQHDQYFYDLCDERGMVVWAEIPYISEHMPHGRENTIQQMKELIIQNYNHPSIVCWGVSNEITISTKDKADMLDNHRVLNDLCHEMDPTRFTTLACYAMCGPFNPVAHLTDVVSWNLYLGWYVPGKFLNDLWIGFFHLIYPNRCLGYSEYGCEGMPNLHSSHPRRNDHTEEYQAIYHEFMLKCFRRHPWMWANHVWNMFDFAADARDQGGEPGMNHKGLVTFDRKTKKDSFYLYKAWWSQEPFVHLCSKRYADRCESRTVVKAYSNQPAVALMVNGKETIVMRGKDHVFTCEIPLEGEVQVKAIAGSCEDSAVFRRVDKPNPNYVLKKEKNSQKSNWV